jgi:hypothetical protein
LIHRFAILQHFSIIDFSITQNDFTLINTSPRRAVEFSISDFSLRIEARS